VSKANLIQTAILVITGSVAFLIGSKKPVVRKIGFAFGVIGQPFWFWSAWDNTQWGIMILCGWYAFCYGRGFVNIKLMGKGLVRATYHAVAKGDHIILVDQPDHRKVVVQCRICGEAKSQELPVGLKELGAFLSKTEIEHSECLATEK
jgi:hypothetical protein